MVAVPGIAGVGVAQTNDVKYFDHAFPNHLVVEDFSYRHRGEVVGITIIAVLYDLLKLSDPFRLHGAESVTVRTFFAIFVSLEERGNGKSSALIKMKTV